VCSRFFRGHFLNLGDTIATLDQLTEQTIALLSPLVADEGLVLVECSLATGKNRLRVILALDRADNPDGQNNLDVEEYSRLARYFGDVLLAELPDLGEFGLELGSPGLGRVLRTDLELTWAIGKLVEVVLASKCENIVGRLRGFDSESVTVETEDETVELERDELRKLRQYIEFKAKGQKKPGQKREKK
ncbi:hypothetical protein K8R78_04000, partial [bacterium]|nr:hypothetical protein [bacterium]